MSEAEDRPMVTFLPCGHKRDIERKSVELAAFLGGLLWCLECDEARDWQTEQWTVRNA